MARALASPMTAEAVGKLLGIDVRGNAAALIERVSSLTHADVGDLTFFSDKRHAASLAASHASAVIAAADANVPPHCAHLVHPQPQLAFAQLLDKLFTVSPDEYVVSAHSYVHPTANVTGVFVQYQCGVGARSRVGEGTQLHAGVQIGEDVVIGRDCILHRGVVINDGVRVGDRCIFQSGAVIGSDGFGFQPTPNGWVKVPQVGSVVIGDDVEIGANTTVDRGAIDDTVIGNGVKIDNLVQIAHNVRIGEHSAIAGLAGVAGSAIIGKRCMIGGDSKLIGHLEICDDVVVSAGTVITESIAEKGRYTGLFPAVPHREWMRMAATMRRNGKSRNKKPDSAEST
jgi:UDP-3-O-[3-hydroxymyristoyl] glucosamine N-acyltransferase